MTRKDLANIMFKHLDKTKEDYEAIYPKRELNSKAVVTRYAPSPTGFVHMGNVYAAFVAKMMALQTKGIFYLRIEDTDQKRYVPDGITNIIKDMKNLAITFDEGPLGKEEIGNYGPYIQSERKDIYQAFVKYFVENDMAYPCFCGEKEIDEIRAYQEKNKLRIGYYGEFAKCREISVEEATKRILQGDKYIVRLKSRGNFSNKIKFHDLVKGDVVLPENDLDIVILKSDGLPTYHFAHLVDDYLMGTTHVIRDHNWFSSLPIHLQLFQMLGVKPLKYAHIAPLMKSDNGSVRKLSKRKDSEAALSYYHEKGIPKEAVMLYIATIANSNFEAWYDNNQDKSLTNFEFSFSKISKSGPLFDMEKLNNITKTYLSKLRNDEVYDNLCDWTLEYDKAFYEVITSHKEETLRVLNIERCQKKPRKDFDSYATIKNYIWYMYDEYFDENVVYEWQKINHLEEIKLILKTYLDKYLNLSDDKDTWFLKLQQLCTDFNYASNMKDYKENADKYPGSITDISMVIRVALTSKQTTPDLYEIMNILGKERIIGRIRKIIDMKDNI